MIEPRPASASEAVQRAQSLLDRIARGMTDSATYQLGTGTYAPVVIGGAVIDRPWTYAGNALGSDCAGFAIAWCFKLPRHRPGYNHGAWATVSDDLNCNSAIEDAEHEHDCFALAKGAPLPGDLLCYPTIPAFGGAGPWIGHVSIVMSASHVVAWDPAAPRYDLLEVAQCHGPDGFSPPVVQTDGSIWMHHDTRWPTHKTRVLRVVS